MSLMPQFAKKENISRTNCLRERSNWQTKEEKKDNETNQSLHKQTNKSIFTIRRKKIRVFTCTDEGTERKNEKKDKQVYRGASLLEKLPLGL